VVGFLDERHKMRTALIQATITIAPGHRKRYDDFDRTFRGAITVGDTELTQRLAAILAADAAGFSRLMSADERRTIAALDAARAVFSSRVESNRGRVVDMAGDSVLAVFEATAGAVNAALAVQRALEDAAAEVTDDHRLHFRIGVHLGDVIEKSDGTVYGDGVNIAARLQALAEPGGIAVSDLVRSAVKGKIEVAFEDRGEQMVKNIADPVRVWRVAIAAATQDTQVPPSQPRSTAFEIDLSLPDKPSIAVLPFTNMSGDAGQEYFCDGVTEDILTELSRFRSLFVIARNSSFSYKGKSPDVRQVGKELGVRYVLEGSIRKSANRIRITAQLIDTLTGNHIWAERYDRELEDVFAVQEEVTLSIVTAIAPRIDDAEIAAALRRRPEDLNAYQLAVRARAHIDKAFYGRDQSHRQQAIHDARAALAIDPNCVLALQMLAYGSFLEIWGGGARNKQDALKEGLAAANRAIELDRTDHDGYAARAAMDLLTTRDSGTTQAVDDARRAHELNPNDFRALHHLGTMAMLHGDHSSAVEHELRALRMNPRDPWIFSVFVVLADACFFLGDYAKGLEFGLRAVAEARGAGTTWHDVALCHVGLGEMGMARDALDKARKAAPDFINAALDGKSLLRRQEDRRKYQLFLRVAAGLEDSSAADSLRQQATVDTAPPRAGLDGAAGRAAM
jgi:adenylate cyclase